MLIQEFDPKTSNRKTLYVNQCNVSCSDKILECHAHQHMQLSTKPLTVYFLLGVRQLPQRGHLQQHIPSSCFIQSFHFVENQKPKPKFFLKFWYNRNNISSAATNQIILVLNYFVNYFCYSFLLPKCKHVTLIQLQIQSLLYLITYIIIFVPFFANT